MTVLNSVYGVCDEPGRTSKEVFVSVVTPFYNTAEYLEECILSVQGQTHSNWEYILSDNCSTDGSRDIAEKFARNDPRIRLFPEKEFVSQVKNYNRALRYISPESKYCKIVQADDWIYPECLAQMIAVAESADNVGLVSSFCLYGNKPAHIGLPLDRGPVYPGRFAGRSQLLGSIVFGSPTCMMYRSDTVRDRDPFFSITTEYFEDTDICFEILREHDFGFVPRILSYNRRDNDSFWSRINHYNPMLLYDLMFLHLFGTEFLGKEELDRRRREVESGYYEFLAYSVLHKRESAFWDFHTKGLNSVGYHLSSRKILSHLFAICADLLLNPKKCFEGLLRRVRKPKIAYR